MVNNITDPPNYTVFEIIFLIILYLSDLYEGIEEEFLCHPLLEKEISDAHNGPTARKHLIQQVHNSLLLCFGSSVL